MNGGFFRQNQLLTYFRSSGGVTGHSLQSFPFAKAEILLMTPLSRLFRPDRKVEIGSSAFDGRRRPIAVG
jgi:hypothetical protein